MPTLTVLLASGISWGCSPTHPDAKVRRRSIQLQRNALQRAAWLGCRSMLFVPGAIIIPWDPSYPPVRTRRPSIGPARALPNWRIPPKTSAWNCAWKTSGTVC
jgi:hypothetical protein